MRSSSFIVALLVSCLATLPVRGQNRVLAETEGGYNVTVGEVGKYLETHPLLMYTMPHEQAFREALEGAVTEELKRIDFFESGLARDSAFLEGVQRNVTEELGLAYGKNQYEDRYLNEEAIRAEYEEMGRVVGYQQVLLDKSSGASESSLDSLRTVVKQIQQKMRQGASVEALVRQYAEYGASTHRRGGMTWVNWKQTRGNRQAFILFHLSPGDVRSFEGKKSFSISRIERIEETSVPPFGGEVRQEIVSALNEWNAPEATRAFRQEWNGLVDMAALQWNSTALEQVLKWVNTPGFVEGDYRSTVQQYLAEHEDARIMSDGNVEVRFSDLPRLIGEVLTPRSSGGHDREFVQDFLVEAVRTERLADRARALGLEDEVLRPDTPSSVLANRFVRFYNQERIESRLPEPTEARLRSFYEAHDDSLFYQLARVSTRIIVRSDEEEIEALWEEVQQGASFEEVSHQRLVRTFERKRDGELVTLNTQEPPYLGEVAFGMEKGDVEGPIAYKDAKGNKRYAIVRATGRQEERQLAFDEVRDRVAEAFTEHHRARIAAEVAQNLREKYEVTIHEDVLRRYLAANAQAP